ncbi:hypothetical protein D3C78_1133160 [compost metagenome]
MRVDVHQAAVHLAEGAVGTDRLDAGHDRLVVEDAAVHQHRLLGIFAALAVVAEVLRQKARARRPGQVPLGQQVIDLAQLGGRETAGIGRRGTAGEGERGEIVGLEVAEQMTGLAVFEREAQQVAVLALVDHRRIVDEDRPLEAAKIGHRHHQLEPLPLGQQ